MTTKTFKEKFNQHRRRTEFTQEQLAHSLGIDPTNLSKMVNGRLPWTDALLSRACHLLKIKDEHIKQELFVLAGLAEPLNDSLSMQQHVPLLRPSRIPYFIGREKEIDDVFNDLKAGRVVTLCGAGGIGKTAIAIEVIWQLAPEITPPTLFPDGIIFHDFYKEPQVAVVMEKIALAFGKDLRPTPTAAIQNLLSSRRVLLVLDGAENADDLRTILDLRGNCGVLVTSRSRADVADTRYDIVTLSTEIAVSVLQAWGKKRASDKRIAEQICELVGGLPLAVRLAGSYMARQEEDAVDFLAWLKETPLKALDHGRRQHESIPLLLKRSLGQLSEASQQAVAVTGLLALAPFRREAVAVALDTSDGAAGRILGELVKYSLLMRPANRYEITHPLVHTYAREVVAAPSTALARLTAYYVKLTSEQAEVALDAERAHMMAVLVGSAKRERWQEVLTLAHAINNHLDKRGRSTENMIACEAGLQAVKALQNRAEEGAWLNNLGEACRRIGDTRRTIQLYEQALNVFREIGDQKGEVSSLHRLGNTYFFLGELDRAVTVHEQALAIARTIPDRHGEADNLNNLGLIYINLGNLPYAIELYEKALTIYRELGDRLREGRTLGNWGVACQRLGKTREAILLYKQSLAIAHEIADRYGEADNLCDLGNAHMDLDETGEALTFFQQHLEIVRDLGDREGEGIALHNLGTAYTELGEFQHGIECYEQSLVIVRTIEDYSREVSNLVGLSEAYIALGNPQKATEFAKQALAITHRIKNRYKEGIVLGTLGKVCAHQRQVNDAIVYYKQALEITHEVGSKYDESQYAWELGLIYEELSQYAEAATYMMVRVEYEEAIGHKLAQFHAQHLAAIQRKIGQDKEV